MKTYLSLIAISYSSMVIGEITLSSESNFDSLRIEMIVDIITTNLKKNGWSTILCFGNFPDEFYNQLNSTSYPLVITNIDRDDEELKDVIQYYANIIVLNLLDIEQYEDSILKIISSPYWHPYSNMIIYYHQKHHEILAKIYFSLWYYKIINAIIVQYDDNQEALRISHYSPYITDDYKLQYLYGCWTKRKIGIPVSEFEDGFICVENCHNVTLHSKLRAKNLGTCIGFSIITVPYTSKNLTNLDLFEDKSKDFHGFVFRAYVTEIKPLFVIDDNGNGTYTLGSRDGSVWTAMSKLMNFKIDLTPSVSSMKEPFKFDLNIQQIFDFSMRKVDFYLGPIYLFDVIIVQIDFTFPYKESGVCIMSHRVGFDTTLFDTKSIHANQGILVKFAVSFFCVWIIFSIYQWIEKQYITFDQIGKDFLNTIRTALMITLCNPPRRPSFRIFLTVSIWSFFIINFASQAAIISFLTAAKRGKDVDTFEEMIEKGYLIYGMASPDQILPDDEERFRIINSRLVSVQNIFGCVNNITQDKERFCLIDCAVGRHLERNKLNENGEQYLHIAQDRMHSHYLSILQTKNSPITERFNKYLMIFYEAGLIRKWEQYRYNDIKEEAPIRPLGMKDLNILFNGYCIAVGLICILFLVEIMTFYTKKFLKRCLFKLKTKYGKNKPLKIR